MQEKIGNVVLDYEYYSGEDFYSDGSVEDELLEIAQLQLDDYSSLLAERNSWPAVYHFSRIRQNIVEWIPIEHGASVLEIGSDDCEDLLAALAPFMA